MAPTKRIDKTSPIPYYFQLNNILKEDIDNGTWKHEEPLPSEAKLCSMFEVSRTVVRQALNELEKDGLVRREKGRGTFVTKCKIQEHFIQKTYGFYQEMTSKGLEVKTEIIECKLITPHQKIIDYLRLKSNQKVVKISRLRVVNEELVVFVVNYLRSDLCPGLEEEDLTDKSLYQVLWEKYGLKISYGKRDLEAKVASKYEAKIMKVCKGTPLMYLESLSYLEDGTPLEYFEAWHRGDRCKFSVELVPVRGSESRISLEKTDSIFWLGTSSENQHKPIR